MRSTPGCWPVVPHSRTILRLRRRHRRVLEAICAHPAITNIQWRDIEALFIELEADISEREGSRVAVVRFPAGTSIRHWLAQHGVVP